MPHASRAGRLWVLGWAPGPRGAANGSFRGFDREPEPSEVMTPKSEGGGQLIMNPSSFFLSLCPCVRYQTVRAAFLGSKKN